MKPAIDERFNELARIAKCQIFGKASIISTAKLFLLLKVIRWFCNIHSGSMAEALK
jgi:hypothetical protein